MILFRFARCLVGLFVMTLGCFWFVMTCWDGKEGQSMWLHNTIGISIRAILLFPYYQYFIFNL